jgi:lipopolysaccharide/colanic/teichoic acid biosynthesis glycosyltransferase
MKRVFDIFSSLIVLLLLSPVFLLIIVVVAVSSKGGPFYSQVRVGRHGKHFRLHKFRTMYKDADKRGQLTVGGRDPRITPVGYYLRKTKFDEFPQLINILKGEMSVVGPRPEVPKYVALYTPEQRQVLSVRPGLTDFASLEYINESEVLATFPDPEQGYIQEVMPAKLTLNLKYIRQMGLRTDIQIIFRTIGSILR